MNDRLYRSNHDRMLLGVCGGLAERLEIDPTLVRLGLVVALCTGWGFFAYFIAAMIIPRAPELGAGVRTRALQQRI